MVRVNRNLGSKQRTKSGKKDVKMIRNEVRDECEEDVNIEVNESIGKQEDIETHVKIKRKTNKFREKCMAKRLEKGMIMLSPNIERKIYNLKKTLRNKGLDGEEIRQIIRKKRREEENRYNRDMSKGCFKCRKFGHKLADCPLIRNDCREGVDICYRCGSSEHKLSDCTQKSDDLPFAKCFVCSKIGHLTRDCSLNKRGIYPKGGSCKKCGSVNHLIKDCLQDQNESDTEEFTLPTFDPNFSADADVVVHTVDRHERLGGKKKFVKF